MCLSLPAVADVSAARAAMAQYNAEMDLAAEAAAKNNVKSAASHEAAARKYLKEACDQFAAADAMESNDVSVLRDYAGACMKNDDYDLAAHILDRVDRANVGLQYDSFHAQMIHGDALPVWHRFGDRAFHAQLGAAPDRSEPGRGPTDFKALFAAIDASGYNGWVSAEYTPSTARTEDSLHWMRL